MQTIRIPAAVDNDQLDKAVKHQDRDAPFIFAFVLDIMSFYYQSQETQDMKSNRPSLSQTRPLEYV
jgi:hypothetical protein